MSKDAFLILEDGSVYEGKSFGYDGTCEGEVVFNTSFCGYQEVLTDPSYEGQIVVMTTSHIGNYGVNDEDFESDRIYLEGFISLRFSEFYSNFRANKSLKEFLSDQKVVAVDHIDTRAVTRKIRVKGALNGFLTTDSDRVKLLAEKTKEISPMTGRGLADQVTGSRKVSTSGDFTVALVDCGYKENIAREFQSRGASVTVISLNDFESFDPVTFDYICISNGPGDPVPVESAKKFAKKVIDSKKPLLGICLGHQVIASALGVKINKLKFGHHGSNHPVRDEQSKKVYITSQNHGFSVDEESAKEHGFEIKFRNLYDGSIEGIVNKDLRLYCVQFHPEASPGPHETGYIFDEFLKDFRVTQDS